MNFSCAPWEALVGRVLQFTPVQVLGNAFGFVSVAGASA